MQAKDILGDLTADIDSNFPMTMQGIGTHSLGTLGVGDLWAMIWIVKDQGLETPFQLHSDFDWTSGDNPLEASDELATGNTQFVEIISTLNEVKILCKTNQFNLIENQSYKIYGRIGKKT